MAKCAECGKMKCACGGMAHRTKKAMGGMMTRPGFPVSGERTRPGFPVGAPDPKGPPPGKGYRKPDFKGEGPKKFMAKGGMVRRKGTCGKNS